MKNEDFRIGPGLNNWAKTASELAVIVLPLAAWRDYFGGVPMFNQLSICDAKQVIEGGMVSPTVTLADAKYEVTLSKNTMDALIVDAPATRILDFQQ